MQKGHAQFIVVPSRARIAELFEAATGQPLTVGSFWKKWNAVAAEAYAWLLDYIRPCHQQILKETLDGGSELPLFRQLLRPHELSIKNYKKGWILTELNVKVVKVVEDKPGATIVWT